MCIPTAHNDAMTRSSKRKAAAAAPAPAPKRQTRGGKKKEDKEGKKHKKKHKEQKEGKGRRNLTENEIDEIFLLGEDEPLAKQGEKVEEEVKATKYADLRKWMRGQGVDGKDEEVVVVFKCQFDWSGYHEISTPTSC